jgi:uncharacterized membrane protein
MNQHGGLETPDTAWGPLRMAYLQYASDPLTFFSVRLLYREPEWMRDPRGPDVSPALRWFPVVTMLQLAADMPVGGTEYSRYSPSSRLADGAPRRPRCVAVLMKGST